MGDYYIRAEILLLRGNQIARGHVVVRSKDPCGNDIGRSLVNPILDGRIHQVKFTGVKITELVASIIAD